GIRDKLVTGVQTCALPISSTGFANTEMAGLLESEGCSVAPVMDASKKSTATPFLGVSPIVRLNGAPLLTVMGFMELQAKSPPTEIGRASCRERMQSQDDRG